MTFRVLLAGAFALAFASGALVTHLAQPPAPRADTYVAAAQHHASIDAPTSTSTTPLPTIAAPGLTSARPASAFDMDAVVGALVGFSGKTNQQRQSYIAETLFPSSGLTDVELQPVPYRGVWGEEYGNWDSLHNIIATRRGTLPDGLRRTIVLGGHYDKVTYPWRSPSPGHSDGILDNGSGVAVLATLARALPAPQNDLVFAAFATEEPPPFFNGSRTYFGSLPPQQRAQVAAYVNFDVLGRGALAAVINSTPRLALAAAAAVQAEGIPFARVPVSTNNNSDHLSALAWGIPVLALTCTDYTARDIHVPEDNLSVIDPETLWEQTRGAWAAVRAVDDLLAAEARAVAGQRR